MSKVTSKLQVTLPKAIAEQYHIKPGDEISWVPAGDSIRVAPAKIKPSYPSPLQRLKWFDQATERQKKRQEGRDTPSAGGSRGWTRNELY